ncbi:hypothetical protein ACLOJK_005923 [Asimina triloba]
MKLKIVCRKLYDYVRYDLKEIAFPSSLPDPPHIIKRRKLTWKERLEVFKKACRLYAASWVRDIGPDLRPDDYKKDEGSSVDKENGANEQKEPSTLEDLAVAARGGMETLRPALQQVYMARASAYRDALKSFIQGYQEGIQQVLAAKEDAQSKQKKDNPQKSMCAKKRSIKEGKSCHAQAIQIGLKTDTFISNILINMYSKCRLVDSAYQVFDRMPQRSIVSWSTMIGAFMQHGEEQEALKLFKQMQNEGVPSTEFTLSSILCACAANLALWESKQLHVFAIKSSLDSNVFVGTAVLDVYAKCYLIEDARKIFDGMEEKSDVTWSSIIAGLVQNDLHEEALILFHQTQKTGLEHTQFTLSAALSACASLSAQIEGAQVHAVLLRKGFGSNFFVATSLVDIHAGLVEQGKKYFDLMIRDIRIKPNVHHYSCMVDLLGRSGLISEAQELIEGMPFEATAAIWGSLLSSCRVHGDLESAECAALHLFKIEPDNAGNHVLLSNAYAANKKWQEVINARRALKDSGVKKVMGRSWIEVKKQVHTFVVGERSHPKITEIHAKLDDLEKELKMSEYKAEIEHDLHDVCQDQKAELLRHHSEKLALAFGLISLSPSAPIIIKKNLRICGDCHSFMKLTSKITDRVIIVRDRLLVKRTWFIQLDVQGIVQCNVEPFVGPAILEHIPILEKTLLLSYLLVVEARVTPSFSGATLAKVIIIICNQTRLCEWI